LKKYICKKKNVLYISTLVFLRWYFVSR